MRAVCNGGGSKQRRLIGGAGGSTGHGLLGWRQNPVTQSRPSARDQPGLAEPEQAAFGATAAHRFSASARLLIWKAKNQPEGSLRRPWVLGKRQVAEEVVETILCAPGWSE